MNNLDELNPNADSIIKETIFFEINYLYQNLLENHDDFFEFNKPKELDEEEYVDWLSTKTHEALVFAFENILK